VMDYLKSDAGSKAPTGYFKISKAEIDDSYDDHDEDEGYVTLHRTERYRPYPDLALAGSAVQMVNQGKVALVDGTSLSAPVFAAMVAGIVSERKAAGLNVNDAVATHTAYTNYRDARHWNATRGYRLGWLNPTLYAGKSSFEDITVGSNTDGRGVSCPKDDSSYYNGLSYGDEGKYLKSAAGFEATVGWDPASGLSSIDYPSLRALFPTSVATDAGTGCIGCDYYTNYEGENDAQSEERFSPPSPPSAYYYG
jgi:subtilase family serine protease